MITSFNSQVLSAFGQVPTNLAWSLSGALNTVVLDAVGTSDGKTVRGLAFNSLTSPASGTGTLVSLSVSDGTTFRVDGAYDGALFALVYTDDSSSLFTCMTGTALQSLTDNGFDTVTAEVRRKVVLGYR